jgi:hypothetical protein
MIEIYLESCPMEWLSGSLEEVKQADEILARNWDKVKPYIIQVQKQEQSIGLEVPTQGPSDDTLDTHLPELA